MIETKQKEITIFESFSKMVDVIKLEKREISAIYFYAIMNGIIQLSLPLGIQTIINFSQAAAGSNSLPVSIILLIAIVLIGIIISGVVQVNQMKIVEKIEQSIFTTFSLDFSFKIPKIDSKEINNAHLPELIDRKSTRLNSSHEWISRMPSSA